MITDCFFIKDQYLKQKSTTSIARMPLYVVFKDDTNFKTSNTRLKLSSKLVEGEA